MDRWLISFLLGVILSLFSPTVPELFYITLLILTLAIFYVCKSLRSFICLALGLLWGLNQANQLNQTWKCNNLKPETVFNKAQELTFSVASVTLTEGNAGHQQRHIYVNVTHLDNKLLRCPFNMRLTWQDEHLPIAQGMTVNANVRMKPTYSLGNTGTFNYRKWLLAKHVITTGYVRKSDSYEILDHQITLRQRWLNQYLLSLCNDCSPLILALTFGERAHFGDEEWQVLSATGTQHLMAISGLHIGLVAVMTMVLLSSVVRLFSLILVLCTRSSSLLNINIQPYLLVASFVMTCFYGYLAGLSIPTMRALSLFGLFVLMKVCSTQISLFRLLLLSSVIMVLINPAMIMASSFWLSFYAVSVILFVIWRFQLFSSTDQKSLARRFFSHMKLLVLIQLGLVIFMIPINSLLFGQLAPYSGLSNLIAVPVVSFIVMPLLMVSVITAPMSQVVSSSIISLADSIVGILWRFLAKTASAQSAVLPLLTWHKVLLIACVLALFALCVWHQRIRWKTCLNSLAIAVIIFCCFAFSYRSTEDWTVYALDVGQGLSVVILHQGEALVYDTGASYPSGFNMAEAVIKPFLQAKNINKVSYLIVSHDDNDHAGGLKKLVTHFPVEQLIFNDDYEKKQDTETATEENKGIASKTSCISGKRWQWKQLTLSAIHPSTGRSEDNDDSCVMHISDGRHALLLTGDISVKTEQALVQANALSNVDILIAPHHGSKTSSSMPFILSTLPEYVVFSAGFMNRWRMPNQVVLERYEKAGIKTFQTNREGMIKIDIQTQGIEILTYRTDISPYWFTQLK